jgi:hypothetical protein
MRYTIITDTTTDGGGGATHPAATCGKAAGTPIGTKLWQAVQVQLQLVGIATGTGTWQTSRR